MHPDPHFDPASEPSPHAPGSEGERLGEHIKVILIVVGLLTAILCVCCGWGLALNYILGR